MKICLLGNGFVGSAVAKRLETKYDLIVVGSAKDYFQVKYFDLIINCAGVSTKWKVEKDFRTGLNYDAAVFERIYKIRDINPIVKLIHISSICATEKSHYGRIKFYFEQCADEFDSCILRLGALVGNGLKKNVIFDIVQGNPLYAKPDSIYNCIGISAVSEIIEYLILHWKKRGVINVAAKDSISIEKVLKLANRVPNIVDTAKTDMYQTNTDKLQMFYSNKSSKFYIIQYLKSMGCYSE